MDLFLSGVKLPKLGSIKDKVMRDFHLKKSQSALYESRFAYMTCLLLTEGRAEAVRSIESAWKDLVHTRLFMESTAEQRDQDMLKEYQSWKHVVPILKVNPKGGVEVSLGLDKNPPKKTDTK